MSDNVFDEKAKTWDDDPAHVERARVVAGALRDALPLDGSVRLLEYGAGTGLVSQFLHDAVGPVTMADTSAGMREAMAAKVEAGTIPGATILDLDVSAPEAALPDERFDLVVTVLTLHHLHELAPALANLRALLAPGGRLAIVDLDREDGSFHADGFAGHHGFDHAELVRDLQRAGFVDVTVQPCSHIVRDGQTYPMFLALAAVADAAQVLPPPGRG